MNEQFKEQLKQEGYEVWAVDGQFLLLDLVGEFIDSRHQSEADLVQYCERNVLTFLD